MRPRQRETAHGKAYPRILHGVVYGRQDLGVRYSCDALLSRIVNDECIGDFISLDITTGDRTYRITGEGGRDDLMLSAAGDCGVLYVEELDVKLVNGRSGVGEAGIGTGFVIR